MAEGVISNDLYQVARTELNEQVGFAIGNAGSTYWDAVLPAWALDDLIVTLIASQSADRTSVTRGTHFQIVRDGVDRLSDIRWLGLQGIGSLFQYEDTQVQQLIDVLQQLQATFATSYEIDLDGSETPRRAFIQNVIDALKDAAVVRAQGVSYSVPATATTSDVQAILTEAEAGSRVVFAPGTFAAPGGGWTVGNDGVQIDASRASFTQTTWGRPVFDLYGRNGMSIDVGYAEFTGTRGGLGVSYRGSSGYVSGAVVWANGDRNTIRVRRSVGFVCAVFLSAWAGTSTYDHQGIDNRVRIDEVEGFDFGILWSWQKNLTIESIYGHDDIDDSAGDNPTHLIYGSATHANRDEGVTVLHAVAESILYGQPFQFKYSDRLTLRSHRAHASRGLANFIDCHDMDVQGMTGTSLLANAGQGAFTLQSTNILSQRPKISDVSVQLAAGVDERGFLAISDDGQYSNIAIESNHSAGVGSGVADINIRGERNRFTAPRIRMVGTPSRGFMLGGSPLTATGTIIEQPVVTGNATVMVNLVAGSVGVVVDYDPTAQQVAEFFNTADGTGNEQWSTRSTRKAALTTFGEDTGIVLVAATGTCTVGAVNAAIQRKIRPTRDVTVTGLRWWSVTASGNYDIGIIDDATNKRLWSKGTTVWPAAGVVDETVPSVVLRAGRVYRISFAADNVTGTLRGVTANAAGLDTLLNGGTDTTLTSAAFPLPDPLVAGTGPSSRTALIAVLGT